jgi:DNA-directed RNA polymerase subunit F
MEITIDQDVLDFYSENPHLDFNAMNRIFINILNMLSTNLSNTIDQSSIQQLVGLVGELKKDMQEIKTNHTQLILKLYEIKKEYMDDVRTVLATSENNNQQQIIHTIEKTNDLLFTKTSLLLNEVLPKNNTNIENLLKTIQQTLKEDTQHIMSIYEKDDPTTITKSIDDKISNLFSTIQTTISETIQSSESRTSTNIQKIN